MFDLIVRVLEMILIVWLGVIEEEGGLIKVKCLSHLASRFLSSELIAREGGHTESLVVVLVVKLLKDDCGLLS